MRHSIQLIVLLLIATFIGCTGPNDPPKAEQGQNASRPASATASTGNHNGTVVADTDKNSASDARRSEPKTISAKMLNSSVAMEIAVKIDGQWEVVGTTPGEVHVPECDDRCFYLTGLKPSAGKEYRSELERLEITRIRLPESITDEELRQYSKDRLLDTVSSLSLHDCMELNAPYMCEFRKMVTLHFDWCGVSAAPSMTRLTLLSCYHLTDISALADLQNLTDLSLNNCHRLKDISSISSLKHIEHLDLTSCHSTAPGEVLPLLCGLQSLNGLQLPPHITDAHLELLRTQGVLDKLFFLALQRNSWAEQ